MDINLFCVQHLLFNVHCVNVLVKYNLTIVLFFSVVCPNGLIANLYGPIAGHHHNAFMLHESNLIPRLEGKFRAPHIFSLYGDPAYPLRQHLLAPYIEEQC